jgi:hypothetical protein
MGKGDQPKVRVTILPSVYDPVRYRRGLGILQSALNRAVADRVRGSSGAIAPKE